MGHHPHVWFGVVNEPEYNFNGGQDAQVGTASSEVLQEMYRMYRRAGQARAEKLAPMLPCWKPAACPSDMLVLYT